MLIQFSVTNFRSIRNQATISFKASTDNVMEDKLATLDNKQRILPVLAVYGANASGKSNLLRALLLMGEMVCGKYARLLKGDKLPYEPFSFVKNPTAPIELDIIFYMDGIKYAYGFSYNQEHIQSEYLYHWPRGREALIFSRDSDRYIFRENVDEQTRLALHTSSNRLYLTSSHEWNNKHTENAFMWFVKNMMDANSDMYLRGLTIEAVKRSKESKSQLLREMMTADLDIDDVEIQEHSGEKRIVTYRRLGQDGDVYQLPLEQESAGTQFFFSRIAIWLKALAEGGLIVMDGIDTSLHPLLARHLVELIQDSSLNKNGAQLLFTAYDVCLLEHNLLRRDQIWFVEKDNGTLETELYALTEFSPRKTENIAKGYLQGRYGAIPFVKESLNYNGFT